MRFLMGMAAIGVGLLLALGVQAVLFVGVWILAVGAATAAGIYLLGTAAIAMPDWWDER